MEVSNSASQLGPAVQMALQKQALDAMKAQGAGILQMIASVPTPSGSVNSPSQGTHVDARV